MYKKFELDFTKIKTIKDVIVLLKAIEFTISYDTYNCPEKFKELVEKEFLKEIKL